MSQLSIEKEKVLRRVVVGLTIAVLALVYLMRMPSMKITLPAGVSLAFLPAVHAVINSIVAVSLIAALIAIKSGNIQAHKRWVTLAMCLSVLFLLCYVGYHFTTPTTKFGGQGAIKTVYLFLLITHISLAALSFPLILFTYLAGWADRREAHRKLAKITFPMWLYVALTGPICYLMLRPYY